MWVVGGSYLSNGDKTTHRSRDGCHDKNIDGNVDDYHSGFQTLISFEEDSSWCIREPIKNVLAEFVR